MDKLLYLKLSLIYSQWFLFPGLSGVKFVENSAHSIMQPLKIIWSVRNKLDHFLYNYQAKYFGLKFQKRQRQFMYMYSFPSVPISFVSRPYRCC